jgi:hypothetical protein
MKRRPPSKPVPVSGLLAVVLRRAGLDATLRMVELVRCWSTVVGPQMAQRTWLEALREGVLVVATDHPIWKQELLFRQGEILKRAALILGDAKPTELTTVLRPARATAAVTCSAGAEAQEFGRRISRLAGQDDDVLTQAIGRAAAAQAEARLRGRFR